MPNIFSIFKIIGIVLVIWTVLPVLVYFCMKFGTVAYFKARQFIEKESKK